MSQGGGASTSDVEVVYALLLVTASEVDGTGVTFTVVEDLSFDEYIRYRDCYNEIRKIRESAIFELLRQALIEYFATVEQVIELEQAGKLSKVDPVDLTTQFVRLKFALFAVCCAVGAHQDQVKALARKRYGEDSDEMRRVVQEFNDIYDTCFGYRYLARLRNLMVHASVDLFRFTLHSELTASGPQTTVDVILDRSAISRSLNATLRAELESKPGDPSLIQMAMEVGSQLAALDARLTAILHPESEQLKAVIREFDGRFDGRAGVKGLTQFERVKVVPNGTTGLRELSLEQSIFSREIMDYCLPTELPS